MSYKRLNLKNKEDNWTAEHVSHLEDGIVANEKELENKQPKGNYATEEFVTQKIDEAQLGGSGGLIFDYLTEEIETEIACTNITLNMSSMTFDGIGQQTIVATLTPSDTTDTLTWVSSNSAIASVSNGVVTAYSNGSCTITAKCGSKTATCSVAVSGISESDKIAVTGVALDKTTATVTEGGTITLNAIVSPDNATNKAVYWTSDNDTVATVSDEGVVTGVSKGTASIGATTVDGRFGASCNVTVTATTQYKNLFDKDTMTTAEQGITAGGLIGVYNWGLARVPVKENTQYSLKPTDTPAGVTTYYRGGSAGAFAFADETGSTLISFLSFAETEDELATATNGVNALLSDYFVEDYKGGFITFTTPTGCKYLVFNTTLKSNADKIQVEEGDTIHDYYLPYVGGDL